MAPWGLQVLHLRPNTRVSSACGPHVNLMGNEAQLYRPSHCSLAGAEQQDLPQIWLELYNDPTQLEKDTLDAVFTSWFTLGRCGGFNAQNLQVPMRLPVQHPFVADAAPCKAPLLPCHIAGILHSTLLSWGPITSHLDFQSCT